jgi:hypothetical protein
LALPLWLYHYTIEHIIAYGQIIAGGIGLCQNKKDFREKKRCSVQVRAKRKG